MTDYVPLENRSGCGCETCIKHAPNNVNLLIRVIKEEFSDMPAVNRKFIEGTLMPALNAKSFWTKEYVPKEHTLMFIHATTKVVFPVPVAELVAVKDVESGLELVETQLAIARVAQSA